MSNGNAAIGAQLKSLVASRHSDLIDLWVNEAGNCTALATNEYSANAIASDLRRSGLKFTSVQRPTPFTPGQFTVTAHA